MVGLRLVGSCVCVLLSPRTRKEAPQRSLLLHKYLQLTCISITLYCYVLRNRENIEFCSYSNDTDTPKIQKLKARNSQPKNGTSPAPVVPYCTVLYKYRAAPGPNSPAPALPKSRQNAALQPGRG